MINFDDELAKFQPSLDVDQAEEAINRNDLTDVTDILKEIMKEMKELKKKELKKILEKKGLYKEGRIL